MTLCSIYYYISKNLEGRIYVDITFFLLIGYNESTLTGHLVEYSTLRIWKIGKHFIPNLVNITGLKCGH